MDMATYGAIISTAAILLSGFSLWLHWKKHLQDRNDRQPEISLDTEQHRDLPAGWRAFRLTARNLDRYSLSIESICAIWPLGVRLARLEDCYREKADAPWETEAVEPQKAFRCLRLDIKLPAAGTPSRSSAARHIHGDTHSVSLAVWSRPASAHSLKVFIRQSSASTSFKVRNRIMTARITALEEPKITKQAAEN